MNIIIIGASMVGTALAEQLSQEGHRVAIVDRNWHNVRELNEKIDVLAIYGNAGCASVLEQAGICSAEMVIAVTDIDEVNLVVGMLAAKFGVKHCIVRIRNREYTKKDSILNLGDFGIDHIINPEPTIVRALAGMIEIPGTCDYATLADGQVLMLGLDISSDSPAAGKTLAELGEVGDMDAFLFLYIKRGDTVVIPKGQDRIEPGDNVHVLVSADTVKFLLPIVHRRPCKINEVIIAGASRIGQQLAATIEEKVEKVYLIEPDSVLAEQAAENLTKTTVLQGDPTDLGVLEEAALAQCDLFCAASDNDQRNILSALLAKKHTKTLVAVVVHQPDYVSVLDSLGVEIVVSPHLVTVGEILMHVRRGRVHAVTRLAESEAEILEMEVQPNSPIIKSKLKDIKFPGDALVGARIHHSIIQIPNGDTEFYPGDTVLVFALPSAISRVEKLFTRRS